MKKGFIRRSFSAGGFTLVEVIIAISLSAIALFGIETLIVASFKDFKTGKEIADLQRDLDTASYQIKGVLDEADYDTISYPGPNSGNRIRTGYKNDWSKEFYRQASGNGLIYKNFGESPDPAPIINTLQSITFKNSLPDKRSVRVDLTVVKSEGTPTERRLSNNFLVYLRNKP
ncbi:MAG: type II secretion system protein [Candidatus Ratteibacteria bacterium]|jgi:prepilin-type N-terminal cleavage/methylation domain-containing protein